MIIHNLEQGSPEWFALRAGKPTASSFDKLVTSTGEPSKQMAAYAITLAAEAFAGKPVDAWEGNQFTERGKLLEPDARSFYAFTHDTEPELVGFVTDDNGRFGCSPDSIIGRDGMTEIKCLKAENHIKALMYHRKNGRCPPDYVQQTQGQLLVCERLWCDLIFYHPELPSIVIRQERDDKVIAGLRAQIDAVIEERDRILEVLRS